MTRRAAQRSRPAGPAGQPPTAPPGGGFTLTRGRGLPSTRRGDRGTTLSIAIASSPPRPAGMPPTPGDPAPGLTRGRDPRSAAIAPPPEVPDQVRDGGRSWQDPLPGRGVRNVETRSTTRPETHKPESPRP